MALIARTPLELESGEERAPARPMGVFARPTMTTGWKSWFFSVDHKKIGIMYGVGAMFFFAVGGLEAILIRLQLARPGQKVLSADLYNQVFTMHGVTMVFLVIMPLAAALRELPAAAPDRRAGRGVPAAQRVQLLVLALRRALLQHVVVPRRRRRRRLVQLRPEQRCAVHARARHRLLHHGPADHRHRLHRVRGQPDHHGRQHAGAGHDLLQDAGLHLDDDDRAVPAGVLAAGGDGRVVPAHLRPTLRLELLQRRARRRPAAVAAPVLDLRSSRGVHPDPPVVRHRLGGHPGLQSQARVRLPVHGVLGHRHRASWASGCGRTTCSRRASAPCR